MPVRYSNDTYVRLSSSHRRIIFYFAWRILYAHHTPLRSQLADNGHTFVVIQVHSRRCVEYNTSTIFIWMKIIYIFLGKTFYCTPPSFNYHILSE